MCFGQEAAVGHETWMRNDSNYSSAFFGGLFRFLDDEDNEDAPACPASASSFSASPPVGGPVPTLPTVPTCANFRMR